LEEVTLSLGQPTADEMQEELAQLGLLKYCRDVLEKRVSE
jgi:hypothetical protein